ncbi:hypothetical protein PIB30_067787 [Stylosanthes scabra]|uniref:Uncharacterized protein n=1 Tax=Stylosanthes scabra TaxID=79078 RepID=A0ABU6TMF4_9FABA|nr:hypothetical protein [Stylosanthes scabra]
MANVDEVSMRQMVHCYQQTRAHVPALELFVDFDVLSEVEEDPDMDTEKQSVLEKNLSDSEDKLEVNYEINDEDQDGGERRAIVALQSSSNQPMNQYPGDVLPFMQVGSAPPTNQHPFDLLRTYLLLAPDGGPKTGSEFP